MDDEDALQVERFTCVEDQDADADPNAIEFRYPFSRPLQPEEVSSLTLDLDHAKSRREVHPKGPLRVTAEFVSAPLLPKDAQAFKDWLRVIVAAMQEKFAKQRAFEEERRRHEAAARQAVVQEALRAVKEQR